MTRTASLQAELVTIRGITGAAARTVVALPPSDLDAIADEMRVFISGQLIYRAFDPGVAVITGAPIAFATEDGEDLLTEDDESITTEVQ